MNNYATAQLAEFRRQELIAEATLFRQRRGHHAGRRASQSPVRNPLHRPIAAFRAWLAAGEA